MEWVLDNGTKELGNALETLPLAEAYARFLAEKKPSVKKRKHDAEQKPKPILERQAPQHAVDHQQPALAPSQTSPYSAEFAADPHSNVMKTSPPRPSPHTSPTTTPTVYFYLLRPHTPSSARVLIPLDAATPLSTSLNQRVILEFPTIFTLQCPPESLPDTYMLESEFLGQTKKEEEEIARLLATVPAPADQGGDEFHDSSQTDAGRTVLDGGKVLDVLRSDIGDVIGYG